jgi:hypothetical protein
MPPSEHRLLARIKESDLAAIVQLLLQLPRTEMLYLVTHLVPPSVLSPCYSAWIVTMFPRASERQT